MLEQPSLLVPKLPRRIFQIAGIYGLAIMLFMLVAPSQVVGTGVKPPPEYYYGFATVTLAFQLAFLVIASDPVRYRPLMPVAICEKFFYVAAMVPLFALQRVPLKTLGPVLIDLALGIGFVLAFRQTPRNGNSKIDARSY